MFYDTEASDQLDVRILLRDRREVLKRRREQRASYVRRGSSMHRLADGSRSPPVRRLGCNDRG